MAVKFKITNPYESVTQFIPCSENHYKTNLHAHSTYSDANDTMTDMIEGYYDEDFDILAMTDHGILGKEWDQEPSIIPLYLFQNLWHGKRTHPTTEQYQAILAGTHKTQKNSRTKARGMMCVPGCIEANMLTIMKNHVNGYFTDASTEGICGKENDFEIPVEKIEKSGGLSHLNHPTDWLQCKKYPDCTKDPANIEFFAGILRNHKSCLGIEALNMYDRPNRCDRMLWDELLRTLIPEGERTVYGFSNSDAHQVDQIDTAFMDFILPEYSLSNLRTAMENGTFFSIARYAKNELGEDFKGEGTVPAVSAINVDYENQTITVKGAYCNAIEWVADGVVIKADTIEADGEMTSVIDLNEYADKISCYVRCQLKGKGGILLTQAFICDKGDFEAIRRPIPDITPKGFRAKAEKKFFDTRLGVIINKLNGKW